MFVEGRKDVDRPGEREGEGTRNGERMREGRGRED